MTEPLFFNAPITLISDDKFLGYCYGNVIDEDKRDYVAVSVRLSGKTKLTGNVAIPIKDVLVITRLEENKMLGRIKQNTADAETPAANPETVPDKRRHYEKV
jgi:hypothetical protein